MELEEIVANYIADGRLMQVATIDETGKPSVVHVWYAACGGIGRIVFTSNRERVHSGHIRSNPGVAGGIIAIKLEGLGQKVQGLTFRGSATEAGDALSTEAYEAYATRWPQVRDMFSSADMLADATPMRMYVIDINDYILFDEVRFPSEPRQCLSLV